MFLLLASSLLQAESPARPVPINRAAWVSSDDYPPEAQRADEQGKVGYRLQVGSDGRVGGCEVVQSSGSAALDASTCVLLTRRARFRAGVSGTFESVITWSLPEPEPVQAVAETPVALPAPSMPPIRLSAPTGRSLLKTPVPTLAALSRACAIGSAPPKPGSDPASYRGSGPTPVAVEGAVTVSAKEAKCVLDTFPGAILVADATGERGNLADAFDVASIGGRTVNPSFDEEIRYELNVISGGDRSMPILVYCHHTSCGLSYHAARHLVAAGYTAVLWMRDGVQGWTAAGYPVTARVSRWSQAAVRAAYEKWSLCVTSQPVPDTGDADKLLAGARRACTAQEKATRNSFGAWQSRVAIDQAMQSVTGLVDGLGRAHIQTAQRPARRLAEEQAAAQKRVDDAAEWRRKQGKGVPAAQLMDGFQFCVSGADAADFHRTWYYSSIYPTRIARTNAADLSYYNRLNMLLDPEDGLAYAAFVKRTVQPPRGATGGCTFATTLAGAQAALATMRTDLGGKDARDLPWAP